MPREKDGAPLPGHDCNPHERQAGGSRHSLAALPFVVEPARWRLLLDTPCGVTVRGKLVRDGVRRLEFATAADLLVCLARWGGLVVTDGEAELVLVDDDGAPCLVAVIRGRYVPWASESLPDSVTL